MESRPVPVEGDAAVRRASGHGDLDGGDPWPSRRRAAREWLMGAATALVMIAFWSLLVWIAVSAIFSSGLLPPVRP